MYIVHLARLILTNSRPGEKKLFKITFKTYIAKQSWYFGELRPAFFPLSATHFFDLVMRFRVQAFL